MWCYLCGGVVPDVDDGISPEEWAWLESLPRRTLHDRVMYYRAKHRLEDMPREPQRVRPYIFRSRVVGWFDTRCPPVV